MVASVMRGSTIRTWIPASAGMTTLAEKELSVVRVCVGRICRGLQSLNHLAGEDFNLFAPARKRSAGSHDEFAGAIGDIISDFCAHLFAIAEGDEFAQGHVRARPNRFAGQCVRFFYRSCEEKWNQHAIVIFRDLPAFAPRSHAHLLI